MISAKAFAGLTILFLLVCCGYGGLRSDTEASTRTGDVVMDRWVAEKIHPSDPPSVLRWARDICKDLDIAEAAAGMNVAPTPDAVVASLTDWLPTKLRKEAARECFRSLGIREQSESVRAEKRS